MSGEAQGPSAGKEQAGAKIQVIALELAKAFRALALYPIGHPQLRVIFHASYQKIFHELAGTQEVMFMVGRDGLSYQGKLLAKVIESLGEFATELHIRQVRKFAFRNNLSESDFLDFLKMLLIPAEQFHAGKKIEEYFRAKQISTIYVNEVDFGKLFQGEKGSGEAEDELSGDEAQDFLQARLLVESLDLAGADGQALEIMDKVGAELNRLAEEQKLPELWFLTGAVSDFYEQKQLQFPQSASRALELLKATARPQFLSWLVERFMYSDESSGKAFERFFDQAGEPALQNILERVAAPESVFYQKQLLGYLRGKGARARPFLEAKLKGQTGARARKLIYLLGELRNAESATVLLEFASSRDKALKLEAIRALGKIKSKNVSFALVGMLREKGLDAESKQVLIQAFGERQEPMAVPGLMSILKEKAEEPELREKAAEALGKIGSREALSVLTEILEKPGLFRKPAPEKVRMKAAEALARLGGERVEFLLAELAEDEGLLGQYCKGLVAQMRSRKGR